MLRLHVEPLPENQNEPTHSQAHRNQNNNRKKSEIKKQ